MSEYQYYEFRAIDRPLDKAVQAALREVSSRAQITAANFSNSYQWGSFKGDPDALMEQWFDLHLYLANWGTRRLMIRVPERLIDRRLVDTCLVEPDHTSTRIAGHDLILTVEGQELEADWDDGPGLLDTMAPLRADLLAGDSRLLYLIWLMAVELEIVRAEMPEPLPGLEPLTEPLEAFARFFCLDPNLIQAAAEGTASAVPDAIPPDADAVRDTIAGLSDREKTTLLSRLVEGDPHVAAELRAAVRYRLDAGRDQLPRRTAGDLRIRAGAIKLEREQQAARLAAEEREQRARQEDAKRRERLLAIARRGESVWRDVETEIQRSNSPGYERATVLLADLKAVADERNTLAEFTRRVVAIRERHTRKVRFLQLIGGL